MTKLKGSKCFVHAWAAALAQRFDATTCQQMPESAAKERMTAKQNWNTLSAVFPNGFAAAQKAE